MWRLKVKLSTTRESRAPCSQQPAAESAAGAVAPGKPPQRGISSIKSSQISSHILLTYMFTPYRTLLRRSATRGDTPAAHTSPLAALRRGAKPAPHLAPAGEPRLRRELSRPCPTPRRGQQRLRPRPCRCSPRHPCPPPPPPPRPPPRHRRPAAPHERPAASVGAAHRALALRRAAARRDAPRGAPLRRGDRRLVLPPRLDHARPADAQPHLYLPRGWNARPHHRAGHRAGRAAVAAGPAARAGGPRCPARVGHLQRRRRPLRLPHVRAVWARLLCRRGWRGRRRRRRRQGRGLREGGAGGGAGQARPPDEPARGVGPEERRGGRRGTDRRDAGVSL
mmetsp:Transcript_11548/g.34545  ORF Transcript_11548/g.34545 Transcript_11548/m.34545 type:complete len:337 (-) Transcript_11548:54-1064(-)